MTPEAGGGVRSLLAALLSVLAAGCGAGTGPNAGVAGGRPNVLVLLIDALRADAVGSFGGRAPTPSLDRLAAEGARFTAAWSTSSWTRPAVASLFTGHYPSTHRTEGRDDSLPEAALTLAERLRLLGYRTIGVVANGNADAHWGFDQGFERYTSVPLEDDGGHATAESVHREALESLASLGEGPEPVFLYVHTVDPHEPYDPPLWLLEEERPELDGGTGLLHDLNLRRRAATAELRRAIELLYLGEVAYADRQAGELLEALADRGFLDDAVVVVLSDHGEQLADHGTWAHGITLYEEEVRVPLILWKPGVVPAGVTVDDPVSIVDVVPTLMGLLGAQGSSREEGSPAGAVGRARFPVPEAVASRGASGPALPGIDLAAAWSNAGDLAARPVLAELDLDGTHRKRALRLASWKLIHDRRSDRYSLYHLGTDPGETRDRIDIASPVPAELVTLLTSWVERLQSTALTAAPALATAPDPELIENLRALGYIR